MSVISVTQLRAEIGGATEDLRDVGGMSDVHLRNIIDRHSELVETGVLSRLVNGEAPPLGTLVQLASLTVAESANNPLVAEGKIPPQYFPWVFRMIDSSGNTFDYDRDLFLTASMNGGKFVKRRYTIHGDKVYCMPDAAATHKITVGMYDEVVESVAPDLVEQARQLIIAEAKQMLASRVAEGTRQLRSDMGD